jgi:hypothetical protein
VTFEYVRDNPGKNRVEVAKALEKQGYKPGSVSSLLGQMVKNTVIFRQRRISNTWPKPVSII